jgi:hypothetical protein
MIPAGPLILPPETAKFVNPDDAVIIREPATLPTASNAPQVPVTIVGHQVSLTREDSAPCLQRRCVDRDHERQRPTAALGAGNRVRA